MRARIIMPSHCRWKPCVFPSSQPPPKARLRYCLCCHTHIPPGPTDNSWDCVSRTKNVFPSFSATSSELPENTARFWNPIPHCQGFPLWSQREGEMGSVTRIAWDPEETVQWPLLFWGEEEGGPAADQWVGGYRDWMLGVSGELRR